MPSERRPNADRLLIISNRAPYSLRRRGRTTDLVRSIGGLSSTLDDALRQRGGTWLAWSGNVARSGRGARRIPRVRSLRVPDGSYRLRLLTLNDEQVAKYYHGLSNRSLWPLCHYFPTRAEFDIEEWKTYEAVNRLFARAASSSVPAGGISWVNDFHLALVPRMLRSMRPGARVVTFWHIPFPAPAVFRIMPWARELVNGLLGSDLIGFHTAEDARNFMECALRLVGADVAFGRAEIEHHGHLTRASSFPLGVDAQQFNGYGSNPAVLAEVESLRGAIRGERLILAVDRLDYTKGILPRLHAYERFLADHPEWHGRVCLLQIQVPSRESVAEYRSLREEIDRTVGRISGRFSTAEWTPLRYLCHGFSRRELAVFYRAADVMLVTPLRDGMNLVAQEYVATRSDEDGVLILSLFAGAAERLREALLVNPYDQSATQRALERALRMPRAERRATMQAMRRRVMSEDVNWWLSWFLAAAAVDPPQRRGRRRRRPAKPASRAGRPGARGR
jgi:alpha,alpha-trehalose-phosphate synthase [UDP-forming]